jgi:hypothetical protein
MQGLSAKGLTDKLNWLPSFDETVFFLPGSIPGFEDGHEGFLGDVDRADALHALFAFLLFFEEFALAGDVAAVALGGAVFADGLVGSAGDDLFGESIDA